MEEIAARNRTRRDNNPRPKDAKPEPSIRRVEIVRRRTAGDGEGEREEAEERERERGGKWTSSSMVAFYCLVRCAIVHRRKRPTPAPWRCSRRYMFRGKYQRNDEELESCVLIVRGLMKPLRYMLIYIYNGVQLGPTEHATVKDRA